MNAVLQAIARAALDATGAEASWVLRLEGERLRAVGASGPGTADFLGIRIAGKRGDRGLRGQFRSAHGHRAQGS